MFFNKNIVTLVYDHWLVFFLVQLLNSLNAVRNQGNGIEHHGVVNSRTQTLRLIVLTVIKIWLKQLQFSRKFNFFINLIVLIFFLYCRTNFSLCSCFNLVSQLNCHELEVAYCEDGNNNGVIDHNSDDNGNHRPT